MQRTVLAQVIKAKLAQLRKEQGEDVAKSDLWTQKRLATELGMDASTLTAKLSAGKYARPITLEEAKKLADFLGFDLNSFFALCSL